MGLGLGLGLGLGPSSGPSAVTRIRPPVSRSSRPICPGSGSTPAAIMTSVSVRRRGLSSRVALVRGWGEGEGEGEGEGAGERLRVRVRE